MPKQNGNTKIINHKTSPLNSWGIINNSSAKTHLNIKMANSKVSTNNISDPKPVKQNSNGGKYPE